MSAEDAVELQIWARRLACHANTSTGTHVERSHDRWLDLAVADRLPLVYSLQLVLDAVRFRDEFSVRVGVGAVKGG